MSFDGVAIIAVLSGKCTVISVIHPLLPDNVVANDAGMARTLPHHCLCPSGGHTRDRLAALALHPLPELRRSWRTCREQVPVSSAFCRVRTGWCLPALHPARRHRHGSGSHRSCDWCGSRPCSNRRRARKQLRRMPSTLRSSRVRSSSCPATVRATVGLLLRKILSQPTTSASPPNARRPMWPSQHQDVPSQRKDGALIQPSVLVCPSGLLAGSPRSSHLILPHIRRHEHHEIGLPYGHAQLAQDCVCGGDVEIQVG